MLCHTIELRVFACPEDDAEAVRAKFLTFLPFEIEKEKITINRCVAQGFNQREIIIFQVKLDKQRHINRFITALVERLTEEQKKVIRDAAAERIDSEFWFYIRFDKHHLLTEDKLWLTNSGSCYHLKFVLAPFPRTMENAVRIVDQMFA